MTLSLHKPSRTDLATQATDLIMKMQLCFRHLKTGINRMPYFPGSIFEEYS